MLKSCQYCHSIHDTKYDCPKKPKKSRSEDKTTDADRFRWSSVWQKKRKQIRESRDMHMCQVCIRELYNTSIKYNYTDIQVHHVIGLQEGEEGWDRRLDNSNLISLCPYHHGMAEHGEISKQELFEIINEQENKW